MSSPFSTMRKLAERLRPSRMPKQCKQVGDLEVKLALPSWTVMRSTDREYVYGRFPRLNQHFNVHFTGNYSARCLGIANAQYVMERFGPALGMPMSFHGYLRGLRVAAQTDVVFAYGQFPVALKPEVPILWEQTFAPQLGADHEAWRQQLRASLLRAAQRATRVVTATDVSAAWFRRAFPEAAHKVASIPYFLPDLSQVSDAFVGEKAAEDGPMRVVFVGKQARRKGLDTLAAAWQLLSVTVRRQIGVTVVSAMLDGVINLPTEWTHRPFVPDVQALMRDAHVLVFPTKHEAYGLVLVEGLAAGCAIVTTSADIQRSIVGDEAGCFVNPASAQELAAALGQLVADRALLAAKMRAARARFASRHDPMLVGTRYAQLLWETSGRVSGGVVRDARAAGMTAAK